MKLSRRAILKGAGASLLTTLACGGSKRPLAVASPRPAPGSRPAPEDASKPPHYVVLVTLRGGFDNILSVAPKDQDKVGDKIYCGYRASERIRGSKRLFGPLIGGLERHDDDLCIVHGVRSDTVAHLEGYAMLTRGSRSARKEDFVTTISRELRGDAPLPNFDLMALDGEPEVHDSERPTWAEARAQAEQAQIAELGASEGRSELLSQVTSTSATLERFLDQTRSDGAMLDKKFTGFLGNHFRLTFQAIRGNLAKCASIGSRLLYFDSHSDNVHIQEARQPSVFRDLATFVDLLKSTRNEFGPLFDQTTIAVYSEFGRFPRLNGQNGKDHFPENSWIMLGKGIKKGLTVGAIDDDTRGGPVDFRTGQPSLDHGRPIFLENCFATLLSIAGGNPAQRGYAKDAVLDCVVA